MGKIKAMFWELQIRQFVATNKFAKQVGKKLGFTRKNKGMQKTNNNAL